MKTEITGKTSFILFAAIFLSCCFADRSGAAPGISGISGNVVHGQNITINGNGFGTKASAAPYMWETFESGNYHSLWAGTFGAIGTANQRNARSLRNNHFNYRGIDGSMGHMTTSRNTLSRTWYVSYWVCLAANWTWGNCSDYQTNSNLSNIKIWRMWAPSDPGDDSAIFNIDSGPCIGTGARWTNLGGGVHYGTPLGPADVTLGQWHLFEWEFTDSSASNVADGSLKVWFDGNQVLNVSNIIFMGNYSGFKRPYDVGFWDSWSDSSSDDNDYYQDDTYIDTSLARVYLSKNATWSGRGASELQPPTAWSSTGITVRVNQGSFSGGQQVYLYVVDPAGQVNSAGYPVTLGSGTAADPAITGVSGTLSHKADISIYGSGFGTKTTAAPTVWDDCSGTDPLQKWDYAYPNGNDPAYRLAYRTPAQVARPNGGTGTSLPHNRITKYFAGAHYTPAGGGDALSGLNVCAGKNGQEGKLYTYISYYTRMDPNWNFTDSDHNYKEYDYAVGDGPYGTRMENFYFGMTGVNGTGGSWGANYVEGMSIDNTKYTVDRSLMTYYDAVEMPPPQTPSYAIYTKASAPSLHDGWRKIEFVMKHNSSDGFHELHQDNSLIWKVGLDDDNVTYDTRRSETVFGGYGREYGNTEAFKNNWRYYADVYYDHSLARVMLANNQDYAKATIIEPQIPSAWNDGSISAKINLGKLPDTGTAYIFVFNSKNVRNTSGYPVTLGGISEAIPMITVTSPNGGEAWRSASQITVAWGSQGSVGNVKIDLSANGGTTWTNLVSNTANDGSETVALPDIESSACRIRVAETDGDPSDASNNNFTITKTAVNLLRNVKVYPNPLKLDGSSRLTFLDVPDNTELKIYTLSGRLINTASGGGTLYWDGANNKGKTVKRGLYVYSLKDASGGKKTGKIVIK